MLEARWSQEKEETKTAANEAALASQRRWEQVQMDLEVVRGEKAALCERVEEAVAGRKEAEMKVEGLREAMEEKNKEVGAAIKSLSDLSVANRESNREREEALRKELKEAEEKEARWRGKGEEAEAEVGRLTTQLVVEKELRGRAETREEEERRERMSTTAQLSATIQSHADAMELVGKERQREAEQWRDAQAELRGRVKELEDLMKRKEDIVLEMEGELGALREAMREREKERDKDAGIQQMNAVAVNEALLERARAMGEVELLKKRLAEAEEEGRKAEDRVREKEAEVREGEACRRKLHNTIQELRGNVRVYCRLVLVLV